MLTCLHLWTGYAKKGLRTENVPRFCLCVDIYFHDNGVVLESIPPAYKKPASKVRKYCEIKTQNE